MNKAVSVLLSVYEKEQATYLQQALQSIFDQTSPAAEVVLVLDGPITQLLQDVINAYQKKFPNIIKVVPLAENSGLGTALAKGVLACQHELIARMDTDDIMAPTRLEKQLQAFDADPTLAIVGSNIAEFATVPSEITGQRIVPATDHAIREFSKKRNPFNHMTVMFKKSAILAVGNYQPLPGFEDYYLWARLLKAGYRGQNLQEPLVYARTGENMYARRGGLKYFTRGLAGRKKIYQAGLGTWSDLAISCSAHMVVSLLPNSVRGKIYEKRLRK